MGKTQKKTPFPVKDNKNLLIQLKKAQGKFGCLPEEVVAEVAQSLKIPISEVYGVATFYSFLSVKPLGRNVIRVCKSLPCHLQHSEIVIASVADELGIGPGEATPDGRFSFELTNCIGACDKPPAMLINDEVHFDLTPERIALILKAYK